MIRRRDITVGNRGKIIALYQIVSSALIAWIFGMLAFKFGLRYDIADVTFEGAYDAGMGESNLYSVTDACSRLHALCGHRSSSKR